MNLGLILGAANGLHAVDYVIVAIYMAAMVWIGWLCSRTQESTEDFFVGGRNMPWWATGLSLIATMMSTLSYLGVPGEVFGQGIGMLLQFISMPFAFLIIGWVWIPFFMKLKLTSAYEYLDLRFGPVIRMIAVSLFLYMRFVWLGLIIYSAGTAIAEMTFDSAPEAISALTGGAITFKDRVSWQLFLLIATGATATIYTTMGGIKAVIWTDVIQFIVLFAGAVITLGIVCYRTGTGPIDWFNEATALAHPLPVLFDFDPRTRNTLAAVVVNGLLWHVCTHASDQVALQRYFCNDSASAARKTSAVNFTCDGIMSILLALVGLALLAYYQRNASELTGDMADSMRAMLAQTGDAAGSKLFSDKVFPYFIAHGLPIGLSGIVVAGVFAVAQSSIDSGINSTTTVLLVDVFKGQKANQEAADIESRRLRLAKWLTVIIGILVTVIAVLSVKIGQFSSIMELQFKSFNAVLGPLGAIFMAGFLMPRINQRAIVIATMIGTLTGLFLGFWEVFDLWFVAATSSQEESILGAPISPYLIIPFTWSATMIAAVLASFVTGSPERKQVQGLTVWSVKRGEKRIV